MPLTPQDLKERAQPWVQPISSEAPAGKPAKLDPAYESILSEVAKLESPVGGSVNWPKIVEAGGELLKKNSKDLLIASYLAYGLYATRGLSGLVEGTSTLAELLEGYWDTLFPEVTRLRARSNAMGWFLQRTATALAHPDLRVEDRDLVSGLELAARRLAEVSRDKFGANGPAFGPLMQSLERLKASLPEESPSAQAGAGAPQAKATSDRLSPAPAALTDPANAIDYLREVGSSLVSAAEAIRRANPADPLSYRLLRTALWLHIQQLPAGGNGRSPVPPIAAPLRAQLEKMAASAKWEALVEESESALVQNRFNLDLHRFTAQALAALGASYQSARQALLSEVCAWLRRMPSAANLLCSDGSPVADGQTREWLQLEVQASPQGASSRPGPKSDESAALLEDARTLISQGKLPDGIGALDQRIQGLGAGRPRFETRLALAKLCSAAGQTALAKALYVILDRDCVEHELDTWEPALAAQCLEGLLICVRAQKPSAPLPPEFAEHYLRLCKLSLAAALRIQS
jgi:type VI secretion system protein VasJ